MSAWVAVHVHTRTRGSCKLFGSIRLTPRTFLDVRAESTLDLCLACLNSVDDWGCHGEVVHTVAPRYHQASILFRHPRHRSRLDSALASKGSIVQANAKQKFRSVSKWNSMCRLALNASCVQSSS